MKRKTAILQESEQQPARRRRRVEENEEQADQLPGPANPPYAGVDDLTERVTNAVLQKLQNTQFTDNAGTGNVSLPGTASAVQGSDDAEILNSSYQASTSSRNCTGVDCDCVGKLVRKHQFIFVSTDIPIDMSFSDRLKKIWAQEYVHFGLFLNSKKHHDSFHLCLSNYMASSNDQPHASYGVKSNVKTFKCGSQPTKSLWVSTHRDILLKPPF